MKTFDLKSLLIGVLIAMIVVVVTLLATTNSTPITWEYKAALVEGHGDAYVYGAKINAVTKDGWEVVAAAKHNDSTLLVVLRRAKDVQRPSWWTRWQFWKK